MIKSMTGYGKASTIFNNKTLTIEIKTLNSKQADINLKIPCLYRSKEITLRNQISNFLERGKIDCYVSVEYNGECPNININSNLFISYYNQIEQLAKKVNASKEDIFRYVLQIPEINHCSNEELMEEEMDVVTNLIKEALKKTDDYRICEGKTLENDLLHRVNLIRGKLLQIDNFEKARTIQIREKLLSKLNELKSESIDKNRFEQEIIYYLEKLDITEEKIRLKQHLDYFVNTMKIDKSEGKKLGFITQEMGREINTLGSKSQEANMQKIVVEMKDELEKIKEQVLNVL
ncbi:MAG: YicC/YloC family endoribonuclease [Bacteroidales bacterium]|nr:YicC family protein [Bacteroidales bacterium]MDD4528409.1 YicC family protein [Bacteroidales bacterium]MDD4829940.1 YicC family protein [Bacteroidales bacterium]